MKTTKSPLVVLTCIMVAIAINAMISTPPATWNLQSLAAFAQSTTQNSTIGAITSGENIQHWEKYDFTITSPELAAKLGVSPNTELNVKLMSEPNSVEDMKQAVLDSFNANTTKTTAAAEADRSSIQILGTLNDVICAQ
jgi:hypothetical protein